MNQIKNNLWDWDIFAAQNSYQGFVSHFNDIFDSKDFDRIFVLKGGPGTGKSSFMKKLFKLLTSKNIKCTRIYCSSDPDSLDGLIAGYDQKKIAVLDGTAPHERDAVVPGVTDEIINLGDCWNTQMLISFRDKIYELNKTKGAHYKRAYEYLSVAGTFDNFTKKECTAKFDAKLATEYAASICESISNCNYHTPSVLLSSFGKEGFRTLQTFEKIGVQVTSICGDYFNPSLFMKILSSEMERRYISHTLILSPYNPQNIESIYVKKQNTAYSVLGTNYTIDTNRFANTLPTSTRDTINDYVLMRDNYTDRAKNEFKKASLAHFELEALYTPSMDFDMIDEKFEKAYSEIKKILSLS